MVDFKWDTASMSPNQYKIADYVQKNLNYVLLSTEQEISDELNISIASVSRFWRIVGYRNFKEFKIKMRKQLKVSPASKMENMMNNVEEAELKYHNLNIAINHLHKTIEHFSQNDFNQSIDLLIHSKQIWIHSPGPSKGLGELIKYRLSRFGLNITSLQKGGSEIFEDLVHLAKEDVVVIFGFIRLLPEAQVIIEHAKQAGFKIIIITDQLISSFIHDADVTLFASRGEMWEFHSMVAPTLLIENLIIAIGMKNKDKNLNRLEMLSELRGMFANKLPR